MRSRSVSTNLTDEQRKRQQEEFARREDNIRRKRETERLFEDPVSARRSGGSPAPAEPDEAWKAAARQQVESAMANLVGEAKQVRVTFRWLAEVCHSLTSCTTGPRE